MTPLESRLQDLHRPDEPETPTLSVYLLTDPSIGLGRDLHAQFEDVLRDLDARLDPEERAQLHREAEMIRPVLRDLGTPPRSLAVFSATSQNMLHDLRLPFRVVPGAYWGMRPYLRPLLAGLDEYERTLVVLIDKEQTRLFRVALDHITEVEDFQDPTPPKHRQLGGAWSPTPSPDWVHGGWPETHIARHEEARVRWHARRTADAVAQLAGEERIDRIVLGGTPEVVAELRHLLPKSLRGRIAGEVHVPLYDRPSAVMTAVQAALQATERAAEERLVADLTEQIGFGRAVAGPAAVVEAVRDGRVYALVFQSALHLAGTVCPNCRDMTLDVSGTSCRACAAALRPEPDLVEELALRVLAQGGRVEEVQGPAAERLGPHGGIVALVRYALAGAVAAGTAAPPSAR